MKRIAIMLLLATIVLACSKEDKTETIEGNNSFTFRSDKHITEYTNYQENLNNTVISLNSVEAEDNQIIFLFTNKEFINLNGSYTYKYYEDPTYDPDINFGDITMYIGGEIFQDFTQGNLTITQEGFDINISYNFTGPSGTVNGQFLGQCLKA